MVTGTQIWFVFNTPVGTWVLDKESEILDHTGAQVAGLVPASVLDIHGDSRQPIMYPAIGNSWPGSAYSPPSSWDPTSMKVSWCNIANQ